MTPGPEESSLQKKDKMVTSGNHKLLSCSLWKKMNFQGIPDDASKPGFQTWIPDWLTLELIGGRDLIISSPICQCPGLPSLPFSLQSYNMVRLHSLCLMGKGPYRPRPEVNCCYGCLCLLNIITVLWGVIPLWLACLEQKHSPNDVCLKLDPVFFKPGTHILLWG